jgi:Spy/CpxP family protein refolding chaperone
MKTWIKRSLIAVLGATIVLGGAAAWAHRHHGGWHDMKSMSAADIDQAKGRVVEKIAGRMDLDAAQKAHLTVLADRLVEQRSAMLAGGDPRSAVPALVAGNSFDRAGAEALLMSKTDALRAGAPGVIAAFGDFYDGLRPEQQQELRELMQRGRRHGSDHGEHRERD